jgi:hypothetical protein
MTIRVSSVTGGATNAIPTGPLRPSSLGRSFAALVDPGDTPLRGEGGGRFLVTFASTASSREGESGARSLPLPREGLGATDGNTRT